MSTCARQLAELQLSLQIEPHALRVRLHNPAEQAMRVWKLGNSWGGSAWSLMLMTLDGARSFTLRPTNQGYTRNVPAFIEVPAHADAVCLLTPSNPEWTAGEDLVQLKRLPLDVRVVLEIGPSPEAERHQVAIGRAESPSTRSVPQHAWLYAANASEG